MNSGSPLNDGLNKDTFQSDKYNVE